MTNEQKRKQILGFFGAYSKRLEKLYDSFTLKLAQLAIKSHKSVKSMLEESPLYHFNDYPELRQELNSIFSEFVQNEMLCIKAGMTDGVALAFSHQEQVLTAFSVLSDKAIQTVRDTAAETFIRTRLNSDKGLGLSHLVWNYASQAKSEFEVAISNVLADGMSGGMSAADIARQVKQYLNNPDMMYRRYHRTIVDAQGNKKDIVRWRRRIVDANGKVRFVEGPLEEVGMGHYRSSRKNAERLTRTEINAAYHNANHERWQLEPFVIGIQIDLSPQHPEYDMCDELVGRYPKDILFSGFHVQCLCMANPITIQGEEKKEFYRRLAAGEDMSNYVSPNRVKDVPDNFKKYVENMHDKFLGAGERGKLGYFWQDNKKYLRPLFSKEEQQRMGIATELKKHVKTDAEKAAIQKRWDERKEQNRLTITAGRKVLRVADNLSWEDTFNNAAMLRKAIHDYRLNDVREITSRLAKQISSTNRAIAGWTEIPDVRSWLKQHTLVEMQTAHEAVKRTFARWTWDFDTRDSLNFLKGRLEREIRVVEQSKYATKDVAKAAFRERLELVEKRSEMLSIRESLEHELAFSVTTRSPLVRDLGKDLRLLLSQNDADLSVIRSKATELQRNVRRLEQEAARNKRAKGGASISTDAPMSNEQIKREMTSLFRSWGETLNEADIEIVDGNVCLTLEQHSAIARHINITDAEKIQVWKHHVDFETGGYIRTGNSFTINGALRDVGHNGKFRIVGNIDKHPNITLAADKYDSQLTVDDIKTIRTLDKVIDKNSLPFPVKLIRNIDFDGAGALFGNRLKEESLEVVARKMKALGLAEIESDAGFMSTSTNALDNVFRNRRYQLQIEVPAGKPLFVTSNTNESEVILRRMEEFILKDVRYNPSLDIVEIALRIK